MVTTSKFHLFEIDKELEMNESKERVARWFMSVGIILFVCLIIYAATQRESFVENKNLSLSEFSKLSQSKKHLIINSFISTHSVRSTQADSFYACVSELTYTANGNLTLGSAANTCYDEYQHGKLYHYVNFDQFERGFNHSNGSYVELNDLVKHQFVSDERSYRPVKTDYRLVMYGINKPKAIVSTEFDEKNQDGEWTKHNVMASVDVSTGNVIKILRYI